MLTRDEAVSMPLCLCLPDINFAFFGRVGNASCDLFLCFPQGYDEEAVAQMQKILFGPDCGLGDATGVPLGGPPHTCKHVAIFPPYIPGIHCHSYCEGLMCVQAGLKTRPCNLSLTAAIEEMEMIIYRVAEDALKASQVKPKDVSPGEVVRSFKRLRCLMLIYACSAAKTRTERNYICLLICAAEFFICRALLCRSMSSSRQEAHWPQCLPCQP